MHVSVSNIEYREGNEKDKQAMTIAYSLVNSYLLY